MALQYHSRSGRTGSRNMGRRLLENWRRPSLDYRLVRSSHEHDFLDYRKSVSKQSRSAALATIFTATPARSHPDNGKLKWISNLQSTTSTIGMPRKSRS